MERFEKCFMSDIVLDMTIKLHDSFIFAKETLETRAICNVISVPPIYRLLFHQTSTTHESKARRVKKKFKTLMKIFYNALQSIIIAAPNPRDDDDEQGFCTRLNS